jgi:ACT domain-containing protein
MNLHHPRFMFAALLSSAVLASLASCAPNTNSPALMQSAPQSAPPESIASDAITTKEMANAAPNTASNAAPARSQPQLIKTANLQVTVKSVPTTLDQVKSIAQQHQGDILNLSDQIPTEANRHRTASLQIRVPQAKLDATLKALKALGDVDSQSVTAEDVSTQLVDMQARLKNLRRTEEMLLDIMGRSGGVSDVLKVSQEVSQVRSQIEQLTAQQTAMQNQVAYSAISLNLVEVTASARTQPAVGIQVHNTWESATQSFGKLTVDLLQLGIWLMVYSPYWVVLGAIAFYSYSRFRSRPTQNTEEI